MLDATHIEDKRKNSQDFYKFHFIFVAKEGHTYEIREEIEERTMLYDSIAKLHIVKRLIKQIGIWDKTEKKWATFAISDENDSFDVIEV